jgi:glycosyltransferase involved in cell wall biosynthesis
MDYLPEFIECVRSQSYSHYKLIVCVNQPDDWWEYEIKVEACRNNAEAIEFFRSINDITVELIDRSSRGQGWKGKNFGVGWARKTVMDRIRSEAENHDIIISLDADTNFRPDYFKSVVENLNQHPEAVALSVPYYHELTGDEEKDRAILRYEIYMRYYAINLWHIASPYNFTAIGSAIVLPVKSYKAVGGITPHKSGEDFYFVQKLRKFGEVLTWNREKVYPAARYSDRVLFGTGPAMIKGRGGDWKSYPVYPCELFDEVKQTYDLFPLLFKEDVPTPMDEFIKEKFQGKNIWQPLRENYKSEDGFVKACHHKLDALRILQFLKWRNTTSVTSDEVNLVRWFERFYPEKLWEMKFDLATFTFAGNQVVDLDQLRNVLVNIEESFQKRDYRGRS